MAGIMQFKSSGSGGGVVFDEVATNITVGGVLHHISESLATLQAVTLTVAIDKTKIQAIFGKVSAGAVTVSFTGGTAPFVIPAAGQVSWHSSMIGVNPITDNITAIIITNSGLATTVVDLVIGVDLTPA